jgi:hypothetical protein
MFVGRSRHGKKCYVLLGHCSLCHYVIIVVLSEVIGKGHLKRLPEQLLAELVG